MSVIRVNKTSNYTVMSNYHFKEKEMSLKAKGLLSMMLSLPDNWDYSVGGLVSLCKENETAVKSALNELKKFGYLKVTKLNPSETKSGRYEYIYDIFENPNQKQEDEKQGVENLGVENLPVENRSLYKDTKESNTNKLNTKHIYGEFKHVRLSDDNIEKLKEVTPDVDKWIKRLDEYLENNHKKHYDNHYLTLRRWINKEKKEEKPKGNFYY